MCGAKVFVHMESESGRSYTFSSDEDMWNSYNSGKGLKRNYLVNEERLHMDKEEGNILVQKLSKGNKKINVSISTVARNVTPQKNQANPTKYVQYKADANNNSATSTQVAHSIVTDIPHAIPNNTTDEEANSIFFTIEDSQMSGINEDITNNNSATSTQVAPSIVTDIPHATPNKTTDEEANSIFFTIEDSQMSGINEDITSASPVTLIIPLESGLNISEVIETSNATEISNAIETPSATEISNAMELSQMKEISKTMDTWTMDTCTSNVVDASQNMETIEVPCTSDLPVDTPKLSEDVCQVTSDVLSTIHIVDATTTSAIGDTQQVTGGPAVPMDISKGKKRKARTKVCDIKDKIKELKKRKQQKTNKKPKKCVRCDVCDDKYVGKDDNKLSSKGRWIACGGCTTWVHGRCVGWSDDDIDSERDFYCSTCNIAQVLDD